MKFWPSCLLKENSPNFFVLKWKPGFRFCWKFSWLFSVRKVNCSLNFLPKKFIFYIKLTNKIWNFGLLACWKEIHRFLGVWIGNQNSDWAETFNSPKMLWQFFAQAIYLLDKTNRWILKFWPSCLLEEISLFLCRLNYKPQYWFCSKFPWPIAWFSLKGALVQPKTVVVVSP